MSRRETETEIDIEEDYRGRLLEKRKIRIKSTSADVDKTLLQVDAWMSKQDHDRDQREIRRVAFYTLTGVFVLGALLSLLGMALHFANFRTFDTTYLNMMGLWVVGTGVWLWFAIVKDVFHLKDVHISPPAPPPTGQGDGS
jgi:hypothetical protein